MTTVHKSIIFSAADRYGSLIFFLISTAVLSRLLTPREVGIYASITALTALAGASAPEFGGANYLIQKARLSEKDIRTAFTVTLCMSALFATVLFGLRGVAADFYAEDGLRSGIAISALNLVLAPFSGTISALLRRDMAFVPVARCNLAGNFVNMVVSISLAVWGLNFMAPILGTLIGHITIVSLLILCYQNVRMFYLSFDGGREVVRFGAYSGAVAIVNAFYQPQLILARVLDFTSAGIYGRAISVTQLVDRLIMDVLNPVIMPAIFTQYRDGGDLKLIYLRAVELITAVHWPFLAFVTLMADPIVLILLGPGWSETVPLIRVIGFASLALSAAPLTYPVLVALGRVRETLILSLISLPLSLLIIFVSSSFGVLAVASSAILIYPLQACIAMYFISRYISLRVSDLSRSTIKSGIVTLFTVGGVVASNLLINVALSVPLVVITVVGTTSMASWLLGLILTKHPLLGHLCSAAHSNRIARQIVRFFGLEGLGIDYRKA